MSEIESYRTVSAIFRGEAPSKEAFFIDRPRGSGTISIPWSLIHGGDAFRLMGDIKPGTEVTFRVFEWKAEELGLA